MVLILKNKSKVLALHAISNSALPCHVPTYAAVINFLLIVSPTSFAVQLFSTCTTTGGHTFERRAAFAITLLEWAYLQGLLYFQNIRVHYT